MREFDSGRLLTARLVAVQVFERLDHCTADSFLPAPERPQQLNQGQEGDVRCAESFFDHVTLEHTVVRNEVARDLPPKRPALCGVANTT